ncbi:MAG: FtsX-like permease family protein [Bacteroidales bacterium]
MIKNYILIAWRNITRNVLYSFLNIVGLALGLTAVLFILLYILDETGYDKSNEKYDRIYRLESHFTINGKDDLFAVTQVPLGPTLKDEYPEVEEYVRFFQAGTVYFKYNDKEFKSDSCWFADSTIFRVFTLSMVEGDPDNALSRPNTMVITQSMAKRFFGNENPMGKALITLDGDPFEITGIIQDLPGNSHLRFTGLFSTATIAKQVGDRFNDRSSGSFWNINNYTYILLKENTSIESILKHNKEFYDRHLKEIGDRINGNFVLMAKPLARVHHYSADLSGDLPNGNILYVYIFSVVGLFLLLLACINYMNMATARSFNRSKEVGLRKLAGSQRSMLVRQFLSESLLFSVIALLLSFLFVFLLMPFFNQLSGKELAFSQLFKGSLFLIILVIALISGILAGSYPAFYLSSFNPAMVIKGRMDATGGSGWLRRFLVVFQFFIAIVMIIGTILVMQQLSFMRSSDLGFRQEGLLMMTVRDTTFLKQYDAFRDELLKNPVIKGVAQSGGNPTSGLSINVMRVEGDSGQMVDRAVNNYPIDYDYFSTLGMKIVEGRNYDRNMSTDVTQAYIVNETAAHKFGWVDSLSQKNGNYSSALGKKFNLGINLDGTPRRPGVIIGIVKDFFYRSMENEIEPIVLFVPDNKLFMNTINVRIDTRELKEGINFIDAKRKEFGDKFPFDYQLMEEALTQQYLREKKMSQVLIVFTILTILIAILGLFGLTSFLTQQRTKEVGIRKVLGASSGKILYLFVSDFAKWVIIANILAWPVAWYGMNRWLENFRYRIDIGGWVFVIALVVSLVIALATIAYRVIRTSRSNPVEAIKYE